MRRLRLHLLLDRDNEVAGLSLLEEVRRSGMAVDYAWALDSWALPQVNYFIDGQGVLGFADSGINFVRVMLGGLVQFYGGEELFQAWLKGEDLRNEPPDTLLK